MKPFLTRSFLSLWVLLAGLPALAQPLCDSLNTAFLISNPNPCANTAVTITAQDPTALSYQWTISIGAAGGSGNAITRQFQALGVGYPATVTLTLGGVDTSGNACQVSSSQVVNVQATPALFVNDTSGTQDFKACVSGVGAQQVTKGFQISGGTGPYTWNFGTGAPVVSPAAFQTFTYTNYGTYLLTVSDNSSPCPGTFSSPVYFYGDDLNANMNIIGSINICEGQAIQVNNGTDTTNQIIERYIWDWGNGDIDTVFNTAPKFYAYNYTDEQVCDSVLNLQGNFEESIRLTVENGCATHYNQSPVYVKPLPRPKITAPGLACKNALVTFSNAESCPLNPAIQYTWIWGDGTPNFGPSPLVGPVFHSFPDTGVFTVRLVATLAACNYSDTVSRSIRILEPPVSQFVATPTFGCSPLAVDVTNLSYPKANATYLWNVFGGGFSYLDSTDNNDFQPRFNLSDSGLYVIRLDVTNICGTSFSYDTVNVARPPVITLGNIADTCGFWDYVPVVSYFDNGNLISSYNWTFGGGVPATSSVAFPAGPIFFGPGSHTVTVSVTNFCGTTSESQTFEVDTPVAAVFAGNNFSFCNNLDTVLAGQPSGGVWSGNGITPGGFFSPSGTGVFQLIYAVGAGNCRVADTLLVTVEDAPVVSILPPSQAVFCQGDPGIVLSADTGAVQLHAFFAFTPNVPTSPDTTIFYQYTAPNGCSAVDSIALVVNPLPQVFVQDTVYCQANSPVQLSGFGPVGPGGVWSGFNILNASAGTFLPDSLGAFELVFQFTDANGCVDRDTMQATVIAGAVAEAGPDSTICKNAGLITLNQFSPSGGSFSGPGIVGNGPVFNSFATSQSSNLVIYTYGAGSCLTIDSLHIVIQDTLPLQAGPDLTVCEGSQPVALSGFTAAGSWLPSQGLESTAPPVFNPGLLAPNSSDTLFIELFSVAGCRSEDARVVFVDDKPVIDFLEDSVVCTGDQVQPFTLSSGVTQYFWNFGDGFTSTLQSPSHAYSDTGTVFITVIGQDPAGCRDTAQHPIRITEAPIPAFVLSSSQGCGPLSVTITDQSIRNGGSYFWNFGNGQTFAGATPPVQVYQPGLDDTTYVISLTLTNDCGSVTVTQTITVFPLPVVIFGTQVSNGCSPLLIEFNNVSLGKPTSFLWDFGQGGATSTDSVPAPRYYLTGNQDSVYNITLTAFNQCGSDTDTVQVTVFPNDLTPFFNTSQTVGCAPLSVTFTNLSGAPFLAWDYGQGNQDVGNQQPTHVFTLPGTYVVKMYADNGCSKDTGEVTITVYPAAPAGFLPPAAVCLGDPMAFQPGNTAGISGFLWEFGDGNSSTLPNPSHLFSAPGTYTVKLTTYSAIYQCPASDSANVLVRSLPSAALAQNPTAGCEPFFISPFAQSPGLSYLWAFGNGDQAVGVSANYTYTQPGSFPLTLTVTDGFGCSNDSIIPITVHPRPQSAFSVNQDTLCGPGLVLFTNQSTIPTGSNWTFGTGNPADVSNTVNAQFFYSQPGNYQPRLISETQFGCRDTAFGLVKVYPQPVALLGAGPLQGCMPLVVNLQNQSTGASRARWTWGDGTPGSSQLQPGSHTYFAPDDSFLIRLVVDTAGVCFDSTSQWIRTASWPVASFTQNLEEACGEGSVQFNSTSVSTLQPLSYQWDFGNGSISTLAQPSLVTYFLPASYPVRLIVTNPYQCRDTAFGQFVVHPQPDARFDLSDSTICAPAEVTFFNQSTGFARARWRFGDGFESQALSPVHNFFLEDTTLWITLVVDTAGICVDSTRRRIRTASYPVAAFTPSQDQFCGQASVQFANESTTRRQPLSYAWTFGNGSLSTLVNPGTFYAVGNQPQGFEVRLVATNAFGCADTATDQIEGLPQPNAAFAPVFSGKCSPLEVRFLNLSTGFNQSRWTFSNGVSSDSTSPVVTFEVGDWDVKLLVSWDGVCVDSLISLDEIHVEQSAVADFSWDLNSTDRADGTVVFSNLSQLADDYTWNFGDGSLSVEENPVHRYFSNGPFEVWLIANNAANCPDTAYAFEFRPRRFGDLHVPNAMAPGSGVDSASVFLPVGVGLCSYRVEVFDTWGNLIWFSEALENGRPSEAWDGTLTRPNQTQSGGPVTNTDVFMWQVFYRLEGECDGPITAPRRQNGTLTVIR